VKAAARIAFASAATASAIWLFPATVQIASWPSSGPVRIAFLRPLSTLWIAFIVTTLVAAAVGVTWARSGRPIDRLARILAPLTLLGAWAVPYLPWLPDRAPLLLVFAGPLRWFAAAAAAIGVVAAIGSGRWSMRTPRVRRTAIFAVALIVYALMGIRFARESGFNGDEPHYLIITHSLLADGDLDIANNHAQRDYRAFFGGDLRPDFLQRGRHGEIYSIHAPGLPAILLPAYAVAGALGAVVLMAVLAALTALAVFDLAAIVAGQGAALVTWAAVAFTIPFVPHAWLIYPEIPGALIVSWSVLRLWRPPSSTARTAAHGVALALLPWLHTKFVVLLGFLALFEAVRLWPRVRQIAALAVPIAVSIVLWLLSFYWMYGVVDPEAPYGMYTRMFVLARNIPRGTLGLLFDQKFGLLAYSPAYLLVAAGTWLMLRDAGQRWRTTGLALTAIVFFVSTTRLYMWWGGSSAPARFLVPMAPLVAPMIATAVARLDGALGRAFVAATVILAIAIAAIAAGSNGEALLYSSPHGIASLAIALQGSAPLAASLPTFTEENWRAPIADLWPWLLALAVTLFLVRLCQWRGLVRSTFWAAVFGIGAFVLVGSAVAGNRPAGDRASAASRGQLALMDRYDPSRLHAVNITRRSRLSDADVRDIATLTVRRTPGSDAGPQAILEGPFELPEGRYEARLWFDGRAPEGEAFVAVADRVELGRAAAPLSNPAVIAFRLALAAPAFVTVTNPVLASAVRHVEIVPIAIVPRSQRGSAQMTRIVEPVEGGAPGTYMGYLDGNTYPEGGVFWTRGTEEGRVAIVTGGASGMRLTLHAGPQDGSIDIDADGARQHVELRPDETRDVQIPLTPRASMVRLTVRAARAFVPAELDPRSDDRRSLGCQVRPVLF
jgi:hypothetical protein